MKSIMAHVVAGYPSAGGCIELMLGMQELGVGVIEVQIPFSDPIADGEVIMRANDAALENGMDTAGSFKLIAQARKRGLNVEIYLMSYVQKAVHYGVDDFCRAASQAGVFGLIIPDLPYASPEFAELSEAAKKNSLQIVPVVSPGMDKQRLRRALAGQSRLVYLTSRKGITGSELSVSAGLKKLCREVKSLSPDSALAVGFGVNSKKDVGRILKIADITVVGSSIIREVEKSGLQAGLKLIKHLAS